VTEQEQVDALWELQGGNDLEDELIRASVGRIKQYQGGGNHASDVYEVVLETGRLAYFKPANGLLTPVGKRALANYGHTPLSTTISECAAWQLAKGLGDPWEPLLPATVLRFLELPDGHRDVGSLAVFKAGLERRRGYLDAVPDQAAAGAFLDALMGQQDRNDGNILWHEERRRIYLIDQAFSFATPGAASGEVILTAWRARQNLRELDSAEIEALRRCDAEDYFGLPSFVDSARLSALQQRGVRMLETRRIPNVGVF
jgi:hypothetical protein